MNDNQSNLSLDPVHVRDLRKSGLSDDTIREARIYSVRPGDISKKLEGHFPKVESVLAFPYPGCEGYERDKLFSPQVTKEGIVKYYQPKGTPPKLYISPKVTDILPNISIPIYFVEGEKKCLKGIQEGLLCIGLGGLWNWATELKRKT